MPTETPDRVQGLAIGDHVAVYNPASMTPAYYRITSRDTIFYTDAHAALAAAGVEAYTELSNMNPTDFELYQVHSVRIDGNVKVYLKQPASTNRWGPQRSAEQYITDRDVSNEQAMFNIWILKNYPPNIQLRNDTNVTITPTIHWYGWKYGIEPITKAPAISTSIRLGGIMET